MASKAMTKNPDNRGVQDLGIVHETRCNLCTSGQRSRIDRLIASGWGDKEIARELIALDPDFKDKKLDTVRKNVERHKKNHVNIKDRAIRKILEKRAMDQGILVEEAEGVITTSRGFLDLAIQRATEQITDPSAKIRFADAIDAAKLLEDIERSTFAEQIDVMRRQVEAISYAVRNTVGSWDGRQVKADVLIREIIEQARSYFENPAPDLPKVANVAPENRPAIEAGEVIDES